MTWLLSNPKAEDQIRAGGCLLQHASGLALTRLIIIEMGAVLIEAGVANLRATRKPRLHLHQ